MKLFLVGPAPPVDNKHVHSQGDVQSMELRGARPTPQPVWAEKAEDAVDEVRKPYGQGKYWAIEVQVFDVVSRVFSADAPMGSRP